MVSFTFVEADPSGNASQSSQRLVRSVCMRGRNKQPGSRRSVREAKKAQSQGKGQRSEKQKPATKEPAEPQWRMLPHQEEYYGEIFVGEEILDEEEWEELSRTAGDASQEMTPFQKAMRWQFGPDTGTWTRLEKRTLHPKVRVGNTSIVVEDLWEQVIKLGVITDNAFLMGVGDRKFVQKFPIDVMMDPFFVDLCKMTNEGLKDFFLCRTPSKDTLMYRSRSLKALTSRVACQDMENLSRCIFAIMVLALISGLLGEIDAMDWHLRGLDRIITLQHEWAPWWNDHKLRYQIDLMNLAFLMTMGPAQRNDSKQLSFNLKKSSYYEPCPSIDIELTSLRPDVSPEAAEPFRALQELVLRLNWVIENGEGPDVSFSQQWSHTRHDDLMRLLREGGLNPITEATCLLGLALMSYLYQIGGRRFNYVYLTRKTAELVMRMGYNVPKNRDLGLWLLIVAKLTTTTLDDGWAMMMWHNFVDENESWFQTRTRLQRVLWIPAAHDLPGHMAFEDLKRLGRVSMISSTPETGARFSNSPPPRSVSGDTMVIPIHAGRGDVRLDPTAFGPLA